MRITSMTGYACCCQYSTHRSFLIVKTSAPSSLHVRRIGVAGFKLDVESFAAGIALMILELDLAVDAPIWLGQASGPAKAVGEVAVSTPSYRKGRKRRRSLARRSERLWSCLVLALGARLA